jgi:hypothetical protein
MQGTIHDVETVFGRVQVDLPLNFHPAAIRATGAEQPTIAAPTTLVGEIAQPREKFRTG